MAIPVGSQLSVSSGGLPPLVVDSSALCSGLNADLLDGYHATDFTFNGHEHGADDVTFGTFISARVGSNPINGRWLYTDGLNSAWTSLTIGLINGVTTLGAELVGAATQEGARNVIQAAPSVHTHTAVDVTAGTFAVERLGSGAASGATKVLFGSNTPGGSGTWLTLTDVAAGVAGPQTANRVPYWVIPGWLASSPLEVNGGSIVLVDGGDFGTTGSVTCTDLILDYGNATNFKSNVYTKVKSVVQGSASVTVTPNDGLQTLTLTAAGGTTPPTTNADDVYVWVVDNPAGSGQWLKLVGAT